MGGIIEDLKGGDRRSIGKANAVAALVLEHPVLFDQIVEAMGSSDPLICMRASDVAEKVTAIMPELLRPHKATLITLARSAIQQELQWHLALMFPRLEMTSLERREILGILEHWLGSKSAIVSTFAMQSLFDLADGSESDLKALTDILIQAKTSGRPAQRNRAEKLLQKLNRGS